MKLLIYGSGGHGKVVADAAMTRGASVVFADDDGSLVGTEVLGCRVAVAGIDGAARYCRDEGAGFVVAVGSNRARKRLFESLSAAGAEPATIVHAAATVAPTARIGEGTVVFAGVTVNPGACVGHNAILNTRVSVDHDNDIGDHTHLSPGVTLGGTVTIGEGTHLAIGVSVRNNIVIGSWSVIGVGAAVVADVPDRVVAYGTPARVVRENDE